MVTVKGAKFSSTHAKVGDRLAGWESAAAGHWKQAVKIDKDDERAAEQGADNKAIRAAKKAKGIRQGQE